MTNRIPWSPFKVALVAFSSAIAVVLMVIGIMTAFTPRIDLTNAPTCVATPTAAGCPGSAPYVPPSWPQPTK